MPPLNRLGMHAPLEMTVHFGANGSIADVAIPMEDYWELIEVREVHTAAGTDAGAVSLRLEKLTGTQAPAAGTAILDTAFDLKGTINTVVTRKLSAGDFVDAAAARNFSPGDRFGLDFVGVLTAVAGVGVTAVFKRVRFTQNR